MNLMLALAKLAGHLYTAYFLHDRPTPEGAEIEYDYRGLKDEALSHLGEIDHTYCSQTFQEQLQTFRNLLDTTNLEDRASAGRAIEQLLVLATAADVETFGIPRSPLSTDATP